MEKIAGKLNYKILILIVYISRERKLQTLLLWVKVYKIQLMFYFALNRFFVISERKREREQSYKLCN